MVIAVLVALAVCGWFVAAMPPFGVESSLATFSVAAVMLALSSVLERRRNRGLEMSERGPRLARAAPTGPSAATGPSQPSRETSMCLWGRFSWVLAAAFVIAVELWELFHSPRSLYPTLSSLANEVLGPGHRVGRAVAFVCWGACGWIVATRPRRQM